MKEKRELYINDNGLWSLYPYLITCTDNGQLEQKYDDDKEFYENMGDSRNGFILEDVAEVKYTLDQVERLEEVQGLRYKDYDEVYEYVMNGLVKPGSKVFTVRNIIKLDQSINEQSEILADILGGVY